MSGRVLVAVGCAVAAGLLAAAGDAADQKRPNIVLIIGDDMGYSDIGVHGCKDIPTPHIDSIAKNGVRCTSGYVSGPYCSPTRAGLMTGRYQQRFGHEFNPGPDPEGDVGLPLTETTLPQRLKDAGYATGMVGKWHLGDDEKFHPVNRGFQEFYGFLGGARSYFPIPAANPLAGARMYRNLDVLPEKDPYTTDSFAREATAFIDKHAKEPFFLYLSFNAVHGPMHATEKYLSRFPEIKDEKRKTYAGMMSAMDDGIGAVLAKLDEYKLTGNTLIFFVSDNGGPTPVNASNNLPLRATKATTWEGGIRVPYLVQWKGKLPAGKAYDHPVIQLDMTATALAAAGLEGEAKKWNLDGVNLLPHLTTDSAAPPHDALYWRFGPQMAIRNGNMKLVKGRAADNRNGVTDWELYDLAADIGESKNLAGERPDVVKELTAKFETWNKTLAEPRWIASARLAGKAAKGEGKKAKRAKAKANPLQ
jgi:arylsulfatase A-like enzyme